MSQLNLTKLFEVQKPLRSRIIEKHNLQGENLMENFVLAFQVHQNNEMLRALWDCDQDDVKFTGFADYADLIMDIHEDIDGKFEYLLEKKTDNKGFDQFKILEVYEVE